MTPAAYLDIVVLPTAREFLAARGDRRLAYLSCISAYHLCDYVRRAEGIGLSSVRDVIRDRCASSFDVVEGICNGSKHCGRDDPKAAFRHTPGTERDIRPFGFGVGCGGFGEGTFGGTPGLAVEHGGALLLVDACLLEFLRAAAAAYPAHLSATATI